MNDFKNNLLNAIFMMVLPFIIIMILYNNNIKNIFNSHNRTAQNKTVLSSVIHNAPPYPGKIINFSGNGSGALKMPADRFFINHAPGRSYLRDYALAPKGNLKVLALMCDFQPDNDPLTTGDGTMKSTNAEIQSAMSKFTDYYKTVSYNALNVSVDVSNKVYRVSKVMSYYGESYESSAKLRELINEVFELSKNDINFANYDSIMLVHAGCGQESDVANGGVGDTPNDIWSVSFLDAGILIAPGKTINHVVVIPETENQDGNTQNSPLGVTCHEFGHQLGLPDLYDIDSSSLGVGAWDLMGYGTWRNHGNNPCMLSSWSLALLGYLVPAEVLSENASLPLEPLSDRPNAYKIYVKGKEKSATEYFLVENRQKKGLDEYIMQGGVLIWHIDDTVGSISDNNVNSNEDRKRVDLEVAEGLDSNGKDRLDYNKPNTAPMSIYDPFYIGYKTKFDAYTNPPSTAYDKASAPVGIEVLSAPGGSMNIKVTLNKQEMDPKVEISKAYFYPNPVSSSSGSLYFFLNFNPDTVKIKIFDRNRIKIFEHETFGQAGANTYLWNLMDDNLSKVSNGTYIYKITAGSAAGSAEKMGKIVVLR
ncbi:MAG: M6 family metalloprotease domain-containing protein [Candidatus Wallbacteria bacterium]